MLRSLIPACAAVLGGLLFTASPRAMADADFLWRRLSEQCVPNYLADHSYGRCAFVDLAQRYVLYKVDGDRYQYLLLPTDRITGIEDTHLQDPATPNYFADAWRSRTWLRERLGKPLPDTAIALTVNARNARSQNQLHIHISCLSADARAVLAGLDAARLGDAWFMLPEPIDGRRYAARRIDVARLDATNLFALVADHVAEQGRTMAYTGIALVNLDAHSFLVLEASGNFLRGVPAEEMQDHQCRIAG